LEWIFVIARSLELQALPYALNTPPRAAASFNEELERTRAELEILLMKYTALYDFAPTGYFTLDQEGTIRGLNLAGASLLGAARAELVSRRFGRFIAAERRPAFTAFLGNVFESETKEVCETMFGQEGDPPRWVWIEACAAVSGKECHLTVMDITGRKHVEADRDRLGRQVQAASERDVLLPRGANGAVHSDH
jgi:PAS domain S-box-containing protein